MLNLSLVIPNKEAFTVKTAILNRWICCFGLPLELVKDQGKECTYQMATELFKSLNILHSTTSSYHPQCNSQAEVYNKTIAKYLAAFVDSSTLNWEPSSSLLQSSKELMLVQEELEEASLKLNELIRRVLALKNRPSTMMLSSLK
jgi:hypothetical protein